MERDSFGNDCYYNSFEFQSTRSCRVGQGTNMVSSRPNCSNPHTHTRRDADGLTFCKNYDKFQSTRPRGARRFKFNPSEFQHFMQPIPRNELGIVNHIIVIFRNNNNVLINRCRENTTFFAMLVFRTSNNQF